VNLVDGENGGHRAARPDGKGQHSSLLQNISAKIVTLRALSILMLKNLMNTSLTLKLKPFMIFWLT